MRRREAGASDRKHDGHRERELGRGREGEEGGTRGKWRERETEGGTLGGRDEGRSWRYQDDGRKRETLIEREKERVRQLPSWLNVCCC